MAKKTRKKRKITAWNRKFGAASKVCFATASSGKTFGKCMKSELKSGRSKKKR